MHMSKKMIYSFFLLLICISLTIFHLIAISETVIVSSSEITTFKPNIVIDAGHGGEDSGATVNDEILEKDINLNIALKLRDIFRCNGFDVTLTRDADFSLTKDAKSNNKKIDLQNRVKLFNSSPDNIVISIHQNEFSEAKYSGTQIFYSENNKENEVFAECIRQSVVNLLQPDNKRLCKCVDSEIYILKNTNVPAILIECGFLSNPNEAQKLINDAYQRELAYSIFLGFIEYYYKNYK